MSDRNKMLEAVLSERLRSAAVMSDYQLERAVRNIAGRSAGHVHLARFPELREILPWVKNAA